MHMAQLSLQILVIYWWLDKQSPADAHDWQSAGIQSLHEKSDDEMKLYLLLLWVTDHINNSVAMVL